MIIVEGTDGLGKSTLVAALCKRLNNAGYPHIPLHLGKLDDSFDPVHGYVPLMYKNTVWDRFHMSRQVYGTVAHNQRILTPTEYQWLDAQLRLRGCFVVVCTAATPVLEARLRDQKRDQMYDEKTILKANLEYLAISYGEGVWERYDMMVDHHHHSIDDDHWPSDDVDMIARDYFNKRSETP